MSVVFLLEDVYRISKKKHTTMDNGNEESCSFFCLKINVFLPFRSAFVVKTQFLAAVGKNTMETFASKNI